MTNTPFSPTDPEDDDLLASLYLDGEATLEEQAQVETDSRLMALVHEFETMASDLANVTPPPDLGRLQVSAALDLFDEQRAAATLPTAAAPVAAASVTATPVTSLSDRRQRRQAKGIPSWLGIAAAAALVVGGLGFATTLTGNEDGEAATADFDASSDGAEDRAASSTNADSDDEVSEGLMAESATATTAADSGDDDAMEDSGGDAMEDEAMEDDAMEEATEPAPAEDPTRSPFPLDDLDATTAREYFELLSDQPLLPIDDSPCAGSPLVEGLFGVDSFLPVVFEGELASLLVQAGAPSTAVIVGLTCEIALE